MFRGLAVLDVQTTAFMQGRELCKQAQHKWNMLAVAVMGTMQGAHMAEWTLHLPWQC